MALTPKNALERLYASKLPPAAAQTAIATSRKNDAKPPARKLAAPRVAAAPVVDAHELAVRDAFARGARALGVKRGDVAAHVERMLSRWRADRAKAKR